ncbi:MAG: YgiQ family radical SAM protein [Clostridiales Family XIII bacterium]|nr:YgiQ family radical SAM protein [Clostridiales Family XIII bacterium]
MLGFRPPPPDRADFLPVSAEDIARRGWDRADFVLVTGDAYVDHPSFGAAIIARVLEAAGYRVAVLAQPGWKGPDDFRRLGRPRLGFLITGGCVDSMVNGYSVMKRRRGRDAYSPGGRAGCRPDRAVITYSGRARQAYADVPVIIGGLEASLRRLGHYDYWDDGLRRSILLDSKADLLVYGMGERAMLEIAAALDDGFGARDISWVDGTVFRAPGPDSLPEGTLHLPDFASLSDRRAYARSFALQHGATEPGAAALAERYAGGLYIVQNPPQPPLSRDEMDSVYGLPYVGRGHGAYDGCGGVPAAEEVRFSLTSCRGCFGGCAFCSIVSHQGRLVSARSKESLVREAEKLSRAPDFKGYIHDVGGPTANFRGRACELQDRGRSCGLRDCLFPGPCPRLRADHSEYMGILRALRALPGVKKVFIRSGLRYDYLMADPQGLSALDEICRHHVSGMLKVAPEHISPEALTRMRKPGAEVYGRFAEAYRAANRRLKKEQYLLPYFMSSHPGSTLGDAVDLAVYLKASGFAPEQVQDFYPTPGTVSTCMYFTGLDPLTGEDIHVATGEEKAMQRALLHSSRPENRDLVTKALETAGREDAAALLLGSGAASRRRQKSRRRPPT